MKQYMDPTGSSAVVAGTTRKEHAWPQLAEEVTQQPSASMTWASGLPETEIEIQLPVLKEAQFFLAEPQDALELPQAVLALPEQQAEALASTLSYLQHSGSFSYTLSFAVYNSVSCPAFAMDF